MQAKTDLGQPPHKESAAITFPRSPMVTACTARNLQNISSTQSNRVGVAQCYIAVTLRCHL